MEYRDVFEKGMERLKKSYSTKLADELIACVQYMYDNEEEGAAECNSALRAVVRRNITNSGDFDILGRSYKAGARASLDDYLIYLEWKREPEKKFYVPRRKVLLKVVKELERLYYGEIDFLGVSFPPRTGKTTLCIMYMAWVMGNRPEVANVMSGHSDKLTDGFYQELLSIITDADTYNWAEIFKNVPLVNKSAKNETIDLLTQKRFPTMTCRSIGGTLTGAVEVGSGGILYCDDLIEDLEESLNPLRLQAKYDAYLNQLKDRKKMGARELMIGTRWNVFDPLGRVAAQYEGNPRYEFLVLPALDEDDHSNFMYDFGLGFDDKYYLDMRDSIDPATWAAKYMGEPYIREGLLFPRDELRWYNGVLPDGEPDIKLAVCDVAWGGGDSLAMPIAYVYGDSVYVHDVVFNNGDKSVTRPEVVARLKQHRPARCRFEQNNGGDEYADIVDDLLHKQGVRINITSLRTPSNQNKVARIITFAPDIKKFYFIDDRHSTSEYKRFMNEVCLFVQTGKNPHDDAPDSLAMLASFMQNSISAKLTPMNRAF